MANPFKSARPDKEGKKKEDEKEKQEKVSTEEIMKGGGRKEEATPGEGILSSEGEDFDAATG